MLDLAPGVSNASALYELVTGMTATGDEANRYFAALGLVPVAGGITKKGGQSIQAFAEVHKALNITKLKTGVTGQTKSAKGFVPAEMSGLEFETKSILKAGGSIEIALSSGKNSIKRVQSLIIDSHEAT
ncbi:MULTISPECIES: pre-toxin TG domain-containing protein [Achromobacter]|uniref:pre-toxin TG domain-containing protein n=1 Tax=Achromobacter TaxID=222 RepID=UPI001CBF7144|nr:pre-toxin TG domain-containing protein [Achromobacter mucicolens]UAN04569.1 hypothetical protein K9D24_10720 [Achromobacter mucicolens]